MLSIAKLRVGQEAYQLSGVAQSLDDYYTGRGEADGAWLGAGAERLGLDGAVSPDDLRAVLAGMAPGSGGLTPDGSTVRTHVRRVPGFDLTFKAPKSVSVLYGVSDDPRVQGAIIEAGEVAVRAALAWLEREALWVRRGSGDVAYLNDLAARDPEAAEAARQRPVRGRGMVAATFRHRTSRAGDPLLHWHTLVANMVEGPDGRWGAFVHPELYRHARAAGEVFQTVLRGELTARLGLEWRPGTHVPEVAGVPQALCALFSKRSAEIDAWLEATGTPDDRAGRQAAVLATRRGKPELEGERFDAVWKAEATEVGWGPEHADALVASAGPRRVPEVGEVWRIPTLDERTGAVFDRAVDPEEWIAAVGRSLTEADSTFTRPDLVQAVAGRIGEGATPATVERVVARVLASSQVVPVADERIPRWTTVELLDVEHRFLSAAHATAGSRTAVPDGIVDQVLATASLGVDQAAAVRVLTGSNDAVSVMVGPAGTGKTFTLDVVQRVFAAAGLEVIGAAPSARAAHELQDDAHIASSTIHRLVGSWDRGFDLPGARTVLVVDEAGMAGIRDLQRVVGPVVAAGGRVLLVGDHHQLPEVSAGGGFAALATDPTVTVAELTVNHRQEHPWEVEALAELRNGHVARAVDAYRTHNRVVVADDRAGLVDAGVQRWLDAHRAGHVPVLLGGTNEMVDALNDTVRRTLLDAGVLGPTVEGSGGRLAIGERLMIRVNVYDSVTIDGHSTSVLNGQTGTLAGVIPGGLVVRMDHDGTGVVLPFSFVDDGGVGYAYAMTAHKAQGGTWDLAITVGLDGLYREAGYLVMSRGRQSNWLIVTQPELDLVDAELARHDSTIPLPGEEPDTLDEQLLDRLGTSRRKLLAHARDPYAPAIHRAAGTLDYPTLERWAGYARAVEQQASHIVGGDPDRHRDRLARIEHTSRHVALGQRVKAWDRRNIGTVTGLDDTTGTVQVTFVAADGRTATRALDWGDVTIVDPRQPHPRILNPHAAATLDRQAAALRSSLDRWDAHLARHGVQPGDRHAYEHAATLAVDRAAAMLAAEQPGWLSRMLADRPLDRPAATQVWDDAVREIATGRLRDGITDPHQPTGPDATDTAAQALWAAVSPVVAAARVWLETHTDGPDLSVVRTRSRRELYTRRAELDAILDTAPPDLRGHIAAIQAGGMLPLADTTEMLNDALAAQGERRRWILEHWPHVVEAHQIAHAIHHGLAGADVEPLLDTLTNAGDPHLAAAAADREPWLVNLTGQILPDDATAIDAATERLFADIANYRHHWSVTGPDTLGEATASLEQHDERALLTMGLDAAARSLRNDALASGQSLLPHVLDESPSW
ncbi:MAG: MobF family relaxase [Microbacteriaceae bacterium]